MFFAKDFPEKLRSSILASQVIGKKVKLKKQGSQYLGLCPFHNEKSPSFNVNDQKGFYYCFGCQASGDIITFVMNSEGLEYKDAITKLADDFGIEIPRVKSHQSKHFYDHLDLVERDYFILEKVTHFFEKNLYEVNNLEARNYLKRRSLNSINAKRFRLGFAQNSYDALTNFLKGEGLSEVEILRTGIVGKNDQGKLYDKFRNRIIFPITDKKNRVIAFGGRSLGDAIPKYLNSTETEIFKKNQTLYNLYSARQSIHSKGFVVVVEGYMDVISLAVNGIENVVAGLGTAIGEEHLKQLFLLTEKIVMCLDGDSAGLRAAKRVGEISLPLISAKKNLAFAFLPNQLDPDDFVRTFGAKALEDIFQQSIPLSQSLFDFALSDLKIASNKKISAEEKARLEMILNEKTNLMTDVSSKKHFSIFFKNLLFLLGRGKIDSQEQRSIFPVRNIYTKPPQNQAENLAKNIIAFLIKFPQLINFRDEIFEIREIEFSSEKFTQLKDYLIEMVDNKESDLLISLDSSEFSKELPEIKNLVERLGSDVLESDLTLEEGVKTKFRILLLKDLLLRIEWQYKESLEKIDEIETHGTEITNRKIKEIFDYKNSIQAIIIGLEKEII